MGSSNWSDKTSITNPNAPTDLSDDQKKQVTKYLEEFQDQPYDISAAHFTKIFGFPVTADQILDIHSKSID